MKLHLTYKDDKSDKFWKIEINGNSFTVAYGKTGTTGTAQTKTFSDEEQCLKEANRLLRQKLKKGYVSVNEEKEAETGFLVTEVPKTEITKLDSKYSIQKGTTVLIQAGSKEDALKMLVNLWNDVQKKIVEHPDFDDENDDTIALSFDVNGKQYNEFNFFNKLSDRNELRVLTKAFVESVINYNKYRETIYTHNELETGTFAVEYLVRTDVAYLPLYIKFLSSIDLDHTVEQPFVVERLLLIHNDKALSPLLAFLQKSGGQVFADWFKLRGPKPLNHRSLHKAVQKNNVSALKELLRQPNINLNQQDSLNGYCPLHYAIHSNEMVKFLIEVGADVNCQTIKGETVLHLCLKEKNIESRVIKQILDAGGDVQLKDREGRSAVHYVRSINGLVSILKYGAKINDTDNEGNTLLHLLASWPHDGRLFKEVLKRGGDSNALNEEGNSALLVAAINGQDETVKILLNAGADPNLKNKHGRCFKDYAFGSN